MSTKIANLVSIVFHPLLLATYLFMAFVLVDPMVILPPGYNKLAQWLVVLVVCLTTFVIPALSIVMLKFTGNIRSLHLKNRKERLVPFFYITLFYGFTAYYFNRQMLVSEASEAIFILIAIIMIFYALYSLVAFPERTPQGWTSTFIAIVFFAGVQLFAFGILGEYIGRIFDEVKKRPLFFIKDEINFDNE